MASAAAAPPPTEAKRLTGSRLESAGAPLFVPAATDPLPVGSISTYWLTADAPGFGGLFAAFVDSPDSPAVAITDMSTAMGRATGGDYVAP